MTVEKIDLFDDMSIVPCSRYGKTQVSTSDDPVIGMCRWCGAETDRYSTQYNGRIPLCNLQCAWHFEKLLELTENDEVLDQ